MKSKDIKVTITALDEMSATLKRVANEMRDPSILTDENLTHIAKVAESMTLTTRLPFKQIEETLQEFDYTFEFNLLSVPLTFDFSALPQIVNDEPEPDKVQLARNRSKADRRRKARPGRYKWGGVQDE